MQAPKSRQTLARVSVGIALWLGGLGLFISFYPGAEAGWFGTAGGAAVVGLLSPNWRLGLVGLALAAVFAWFAWLGYQRGLEYEQWLQQEPPHMRESLRQRQAQPVAAPVR